MTITLPVRPLLLALTLLVPPGAAAQETDPETGLVKAEGWQVVKANCTVCHSAKLVTQNSGSRNHWEHLIRWMQDTQGLWQFRPEMEATILDYLAEHYGPKAGARRAPLPRQLMPDTPYASGDDAG
ncbi:hypothetical protein [Halomonas sp. M4R1S46]|uniref:hypothetical protein n=1 Tax=Halomonas sp. M4R1S46 TaxID=2982692 RepID=UPI0021E3A5DE|nr:hypothetical protein [Halomonas sp. M4R1S46]UYG08733.1 hypothetical protein OCT48_05195 [Halomonas sp. M4R1S46]